MIKATEAQVRDSVANWMTSNDFTRTTDLEETPIQGEAGSSIGVTDSQTKRVMEVIVRSHGEIVAVSVYHHVTILLVFTGGMFGNTLQTEADDLLSFIQQESPKSP